MLTVLKKTSQHLVQTQNKNNLLIKALFVAGILFGTSNVAFAELKQAPVQDATDPWNTANNNVQEQPHPHSHDTMEDTQPTQTMTETHQHPHGTTKAPQHTQGPEKTHQHSQNMTETHQH